MKRGRKKKKKVKCVFYIHQFIRFDKNLHQSYLLLVLQRDLGQHAFTIYTLITRGGGFAPLYQGALAMRI